MRILSAINISASTAILFLSLSFQAYSFETKARAAFVMDQTSGTILLSKNADLALLGINVEADDLIYDF